MQFRQLKERSRDKLHRALSYPAAYAAGPGQAARLVRVRTHIKNPFMQGDMKGTNLSYAETAEAQITLVLWAADYPAPIQRGHTFVLDREEGYFVDNVHPPYRGTITVEVSPLTAAQVAALDAPEDLA